MHNEISHKLIISIHIVQQFHDAMWLTFATEYLSVPLSTWSSQHTELRTAPILFRLRLLFCFTFTGYVFWPV